ncbi:MAG: hypothetical protein ABI767_10880 [Rhodanobacter sp.]
MGNTNIPQFGAEDTQNSHDTRTGAEQLTQDQRRQRDAQAKGGLGSLLPDSVANESKRLVEHADHGKDVIGKPARDSAQGHTSEKRVEADIQPTNADRAAVEGHVGTGHSPSDAT